MVHIALEVAVILESGASIVCFLFFFFFSLELQRSSHLFSCVTGISKSAAMLATMESVSGAEIARTLTISMFALTVYDYALTLEKEVLYFWERSLSISHALFFFNRYVPVCIIVHAIINFSIVQPTIEFCTTSIRTSMFLNLAAIGVIQAILITRVWFLFPGEKPVQFALIFFFMISLIVSAVFLSHSLHELKAFNFPIQIANKYNIVGCHAARPSAFWRVYLPFLVLHTGLYAMTAYHAIANWDNRHQVNLRRRLLRDGGIFYLVVFFTVGFGSIGSFFTQVPQINIPAIFSPIILSITSIATNRIMFSLRDITANAESSLEWSPMHSMPMPPKAAYPEPAEVFATQKSTISHVQDEEKGGMSGLFLYVDRK